MIIKSIIKNYNNFNEFSNYKVISSNDKEYFVPLDEANTDYQAIQEWIAEGNTVIDNGANN
jgi:hypothetical protein